MQKFRVAEVWDAGSLRHSTSELWAMAQVAAELGVDVERCLHDSSISPSSLTDRMALVSFHQQLNFQRRLSAAGLPASWNIEVGRRLHLSSFGIAGYALLCADTLARSLKLANQLSSLLNLKHGLEIRVNGSVARLILSRGYALDALRTNDWEWMELAKLITLLQDIFGTAMRFTRLRLAGSPCADVICALDHISGCPIETQTQCSELEFASDFLTRPLPQREPQTFRGCVEICEQQMLRLHGLARAAGRVRAHLEAAIGAMPSIQSVARSLCMSARSLRRKLDAEGTSFHALVEEVRRESAERMLATTTLSTEAIAHALGYCDVANFRHAFKRWRGETPRQYRDRNSHVGSLEGPIIGASQFGGTRSSSTLNIVKSTSWPVQSAA